jgi:hypothetical protein
MPEYPVDRAAFCAEATKKLKKFIGHWQLPQQIQQELTNNHKWLARNDDGNGGLIISTRSALDFQDFYELHRTLRKHNMIVHAVKLSRDLTKEFVELRSYIDWYVACVYTDTWPEDFLQIARNSILDLTETAVEEELRQREYYNDLEAERHKTIRLQKRVDELERAGKMADALERLAIEKRLTEEQRVEDIRARARERDAKEKLAMDSETETERSTRLALWREQKEAYENARYAR